VEESLRVACVQLTSGPDKAANLETVERLVGDAAAAGAELVVLPEKWNAIGPPDVLHAAAESLDGGESIQAMGAWAERHGITLVGGSITESREGREKLSNTSLVFEPDGSLAAVYRKIHLFDVDVGGHSYRESDAEEPGDEPVVADAAGWRLGLSVCYDIRFPELYRILALEGAELVTVPANFTLYTGKDHWHVLLRARAVENQCYVAAAAQFGEPWPGKPSYGRSLIADPWGIVLAEAPDEETVIVADIDRARLRSVRERLPSLANRQADAYRWPTPA
jgi:deaminated glutathione amidase